MEVESRYPAERDPAGRGELSTKWFAGLPAEELKKVQGSLKKPDGSR